MEWTAYVAVACLWGVVGPLALAGIFCYAYRDNLPQWVGLWGLAFWSFARADVLLQQGFTELWELTLCIGLASYGIGTAWKVRHHSRDGGCTASDDLPEVGRGAWPYIGGGTKHE